MRRFRASLYFALALSALVDAVEKVGLYDSPPVVPIWAE